MEKIFKMINQKIEEYKKNVMFEVTCRQILSENQLKLLKKLFVVFIELISFQNLHQPRVHSVHCGNGREILPML
jgi:hypothetical protein